MLLAIALIVACSANLVFIHSESKLDPQIELSRVRIPDPAETPADAIERGRHLVTVVAQCTFCHGTDLAGRQIADDPWIGRLDAPNLTPGVGGVGRAYSLKDWVRALRMGIGRDGRSLLLMPSAHLARITDKDLLALVAFLESVPAVDRRERPRRIGWLTRVVVSAGAATDLVSTDGLETREFGEISNRRSVTPQYGEYLVSLGNCRVCHHSDLRGGLHPLSLPDEIPPADLRPSGAMATWTLSDFGRAMRTGRTPDGRVLDRDAMPWPAFAGLNDLEIDAMWTYLKQDTENGRETETPADPVQRTASRAR